MQAVTAKSKNSIRNKNVSRPCALNVMSQTTSKFCLATNPILKPGYGGRTYHYYTCKLVHSDPRDLMTELDKRDIYFRWTYQSRAIILLLLGTLQTLDGGWVLDMAQLKAKKQHEGWNREHPSPIWQWWGFKERLFSILLESSFWFYCELNKSSMKVASAGEIQLLKRSKDWRRWWLVLVAEPGTAKEAAHKLLMNADKSQTTSNQVQLSLLPCYIGWVSG